jgi:flagellar motor switch protein FliN/FliY
MATENPVGRNHRSFSKAFVHALLGAVSDAGESPWRIADVPDRDSARDDHALVRIKLAFEGSLQGELLLELSRPEAAVLVAKVLQEPVVEFEEAESEALMRMVAEGTSLFRAKLGQEYGPFTVEASLTLDAALDQANVIQVDAADDDGNRVSLWLYLDSVLMGALALHSKTQSAVGDADNATEETEEKLVLEQVNLDLVMDVELNVTLRFGKRQLTLREVLELTSGSVVELDRQVEEPVELLLDGQVIARGEAVVIDGNYGMRVTEVSQPVSSPLLRSVSQSRSTSSRL